MQDLIPYKQITIQNKNFANGDNAQTELDNLFEKIGLLKQKDLKINENLSANICTRFTEEDIETAKGDKKDVFFLLGNNPHKLYYIDQEGNATHLTFDENDRDFFTRVFHNYQDNQDYEINKDYFLKTLIPLLSKCQQKNLFTYEITTSSIPKPVITAFEQFYMQIGTDFDKDPTARRHYKGNAKLIHAMNYVATYLLTNKNPPENNSDEFYYQFLRLHFEDVDKAAKNYKSNNFPTIWVAAATVLGAVVGAIVGFGVAALVTFLTGGLALPVAALIGIGVGATVGGATVGALTGGLGMYHGKAKYYKHDVALDVLKAIGEGKKGEKQTATGLAKALEDAGYLKPK